MYRIAVTYNVGAWSVVCKMKQLRRSGKGARGAAHAHASPAAPIETSTPARPKYSTGGENKTNHGVEKNAKIE